MHRFPTAVCATVAVALCGLAAAAQAQTRETFDMPGHTVGVSSQSRCWEGLCARVSVKRLNVNQGRSELCARFDNQDAATDWRGGYRLTGRDVHDTFASMRVPAGGSLERCEILPVQSLYYVVLRQNRD